MPSRRESRASVHAYPRLRRVKACHPAVLLGRDR
jgi:hypothetical protein